LDDSTPLGAAQLNATAVSPAGSTVAGTFTYTPTSGTLLTAGNQTLSVHFVPFDSTSFASRDFTVLIKVAAKQVVLAPVSISLSNLVTTYTGNSQRVSITTNPAGVGYAVTYDGSSTEPTKSGSYSVKVVVTDKDKSGFSECSHGY
jgi:hypothetical protein